MASKNNPVPSNRSLFDIIKAILRVLFDIPEAGKSNCAVFFSPGNDCLNAIVRALNAATSRVDVCVFTISDDRITNAILQCHIRKLPVRIITDDLKVNDQGSDIEQLAQARIPVRIDGSQSHMHHKYAVIDGKAVITGSYNWTRSAADYNFENVLITDDPRAVAAYQKNFDSLWPRMTPYPSGSAGAGSAGRR